MASDIVSLVETPTERVKEVGRLARDTIQLYVIHVHLHGLVYKLCMGKVAE